MHSRPQDRLNAQELLKKTAEEIVKRYDGRITMVHLYAHKECIHELKE